MNDRNNYILNEYMKNDLKVKFKEAIAKLKSEKHPKLALIDIGKQSRTAVYFRNLKKMADFIGVEAQSIDLAENIKEEELLQTIITLNEDKTVNGNSIFVSSKEFCIFKK